jgi:sugar-specific transcriptional regulator TrmB
MKTDKNIELLKDIGLSDDEAQVYLSALSLGKKTTVLKISKIAGLKRTTVYGIIESLKIKGLMSVDIQGLKNVYIAESPEKLETTLEQKTIELKAQLPELLDLYNLKAGESVIKYYIGLDAMKQVLNESLRRVKSGQDYLVIANQEKWYNLDQKFTLSFIENRAKREYE